MVTDASNASSAECAREIQRLRAQVERFKRRLQAAGLSHEFEALSGDEQKIPMLDAEEV
jgi:hypothetical protein